MTAPDSTQPPPLARSGLERSAEERATPGLLDHARTDAATRVLVLNGDTAPLATADALHWVAPAAVPDGAEWAFLGRDDERDGAPGRCVRPRRGRAVRRAGRLGRTPRGRVVRSRRRRPERSSRR